MLKKDTVRKLDKLLVANRGEIAIRVLRAASELRIKTVAIYTFEDRYALHRFKADEAYQIGEKESPLKPYLDIEEIINLALQQGVDAIHPGYGFLSENDDFARRCEEEGIIFVGPSSTVMQQLGDKVSAKAIATASGVPIIEATEGLDSGEEALEAAKKIGFPVMVKAASGGGGRGMRVVKEEKDLISSFTEAKNEALNAFGDDTVFVEKFIDNPKHIEVQLMGDNHRNLVHLYERDCSVQRRFQKVVEIAPCVALSKNTINKIHDYAVKIGQHVNYNNVGTVEFLVDQSEEIFFIEVNPRIQVEHTITEEITGIDIVRSQILIAKGYPLHHPKINIPSQSSISITGCAIQCRITTEDPENNFKPDFGTLLAYRNAGGFGIRLDEGSSYPGMNISPFFDSMLVKVSARGETMEDAAARLGRTLREFRIRGVKTNIGFLENVITNKTFYEGKATVKFIEENPDLFKIRPKLDRGTRLLRYLADVIVNGNDDITNLNPNKAFPEPVIPQYDRLSPYPKGYRDTLKEMGREKFVKHILDTKKILYTDTTFRDGHQSLLATRMRSYDMLQVAEGYAKSHPQTFSMEVWGGATFDVCMRFLKEDPWKRLANLRKAMPNMLLQMLLRGSNGVGYKAYPDNLIEKFIEESAKGGIDIFRIFDSLNWVENMEVSIKAVVERTDSLAEAAICYTGDIGAPDNKKYTLEYYVDLAKRLEDAGAHMLCIKDMAGLLRPYAAEKLITALKGSLDIPIHLHTHDTSSIQSATYIKAVEAGVDIIDVALAGLSGMTSQPNFNSMVAYMKNQERENEFDLQSLNAHSRYWEAVREQYYPFESGLKAGSAEIYEHEIPGGQYTNIKRQAISLGLDHRFDEITKNYAAVDKLLGRITKVTPSSKVVGDMALFMTSNSLTVEDVMDESQNLAFPESVVNFFKGHLGQPPGGFPEKLSKIILKGAKAFTDRPNAHLAPVDFDKEFKAFREEFDADFNFLEFIAYKLYPKVFIDYFNHHRKYGTVANIPTIPFFYGLKNNEETLIKIESGKWIIIKLLYVGEPDELGNRTVFFELNGQARRITVKDKSYKSLVISNKKASGPNEIGAPLQGRIAAVLVERGKDVKAGDPLFVIEAMKMETTITASIDGKVVDVVLKKGDMVQQDDMVVELG